MLHTSLHRWLRLENAAELAVFVAAYARWGGSWWLFALCFLLPDLAMIGYLRGPRFGAACYNAAHSYAAPAVLVLLSFAHQPHTLPAGLIWACHIAFDRTVGYGLKDPSSFNLTHLGQVGRRKSGDPLVQPAL